MKSKQKIKIGSDFSGVGSLIQAIKRIGIDYEEVFCCEKDIYCKQTYILNYGDNGIFYDDVYKRKIPEKSLDLYVSTPPCQSFSQSGKRLGENSKQGILFYNTLEFICSNKPRFFIIENVPGLISDDNGNTFNKWLSKLGGKSINNQIQFFNDVESAPYHIHYKILNAKNYGIPQNRSRLFIVGIRDDSDNNFTFPKELSGITQASNFLLKNVDKKYLLGINLEPNIKLSPEDKDSKNKLFLIGYTRDKYGKVTSRHKINLFYTIHTSSGQGGNTDQYVSNYYYTRRLTPRECFRAQDFPDSFKWDCSDRQAYKQAGNSIPVGLLEKIISSLLSS